jgi:hypothetical protein
VALLNRWTALGSRARRASLLALLGLAGCAIFGSLQDGEKPFAFSHRLHVEDQGLGCTDCHTKVEKADDPGMPNAKQCALCHADIDAQKPPEKQIGQLFEKDKFKAHLYSAQDKSEIVFSHQKHAARDSDCMACHAAAAKSDAVSADMKLSMESCQKCHAERKKGPSECAGCHQTIRNDVPPPNHNSQWPREHGRTMRAHDNDMRAERCDTCHTEASCIACHKAEAPENHTNYWRRRGHGLSASMDRKSCSACHEPESCQACHSQTKPSNHTGTWGQPQDRHCLTCHEPLRYEDNCQTCHKSTPSHALATPMPSWHLPSMNCRQCHGNGQPLPHVDNGSNCIECHH